MNTSVMNLAQQQPASGRKFSLAPHGLSQSITLRVGRRPSLLTVQSGCVWVTLAGTPSQDPQDLWLSAGQSLRLAPRQTLWVDGWPQAELRLLPWQRPAQDGLWAHLLALLLKPRRQAQGAAAQRHGRQAVPAGSCCSA